MIIQSKNLLILAGYSASGKSTLLTRSLQTGFPLFGNEVNEAFQKTRIPPRFPEQSLTFEETLSSGTWFSGFHLRRLQLQEQLPNTVVVHVDITELLWNSQRIPYLSESSALLFPRSLKSLASLQDNEKILNDYFSAFLFKRFDRIIINTIIAPWELVVAQYAIRKVGKFETSRLRDSLFINGGLGARLMKVANIAWLNSALRTDAKCLIAHFDGKDLKIREIHLSQ